MLKFKLILLWFAFKTVTCTCKKEKSLGFDKAKMKISQIGVLPEAIGESSGLAYLPKENKLLTHNDSGNPADLFEILENGALVSKKRMGFPNKDWEDIATSPDGTVFIGDFGNNSQQRKDLTIYKVIQNKMEKITFDYGDQRDSSIKNFDCEAFFYFQDNLYLFSKSWEKKKKICKVYSLPAHEGHYTIYPLASIPLDFQITGADVHPNHTEFVLLGYGKALFFAIENGKISFEQPLYCKKTKGIQTEAITYFQNKMLYTSEQGKIYSLSLKR